MTLEAGDVIALSGPRQIIVELIGPRAEEVEDKELLDVPVTSRRCPADESGSLPAKSRGRVAGGLDARPVLAIGEPRRSRDPDRGRRRAAARRSASHRRPGAGRAEGGSERSAPSSLPARIDFVVLGLAIFLGGVIGVLVTFSVGGVKISLSTSVGTLLAGLLVGHLRTRIRCSGGSPTAPSPS